MLEKPADILEVWGKRRDYYQKSHQKKAEMVGVWNNVMPERGLKYWRSGNNPNASPDVYLNNIKRSWQDFAQMVSTVLPLYVPPRSESQANKKAAEKVELINYGYNDASLKRGGLGMKGLMDVLSWWLVGTSDAVAIVYPDYDRKTPWFHWREPTSHFPPIGWTPQSPVPLDHTLFAYEETLGNLKMRYPDAIDELNRVYDNEAGWASKYDNNSKINVGEYFCADAWYVCTLTEQTVVLMRSETGDPNHPGVCPVVPFSLYSPGDPKGLSMYDEQVDLDVQISRMLSQELDGFDRILHPMIFTSELAGTHIQYGPGAINPLSSVNGERPFVQTVGPTNAMGASQLIQMSLALSKINTRNPESMQGAGQANSAKALNELKSGPEGTVRDGFWPAFIQGLPKLYKLAMQMDMNLWPLEKKTVTGRKNNHAFITDYQPIVDLRGYEESIQMLPSLGIGGYQGEITRMQKLQAETISAKTAMEQDPTVRDAEQELRRIDGDRLDKIRWADIRAKAEQGALQPSAIRDLKKLIEDKNLTIDEGIAQLDAQGKWLVPPTPVEAPMQGAPPDLAALMGGAPTAEPTGPLPSLTALRG